jgi:hypothetical protein
VVHYVDDFLFVVESSDGGAAAAALLQAALSLCIDLGIPMAADKTEGPTTCLTFLGIELDTEAMEARLPASRLLELQQLIVEWESKERASVKELQSLTGLLNFACSVVRPGRFYLRRIINHTKHCSWLCVESSGTRGHRSPIALTAAVRADIVWWGEFLADWNGVSLLYELEWIESDKIELFTDACTKGFGGYYQGAWFAGAWCPNELAAAWRVSKLSMPFLELRALVMAATTWGPLWRGKKITFRCDCDGAVQAVNRGSSRVPETMHQLRELSMAACRYGFDFRAEHIPGVANTVADELSRYGDSAQFRALCPDAAAEMAPLLRPALPTPKT